MSDYKVSQYGIFSDAVNTTNTVNTHVSDATTTITTNQTKLNDQSIFMGPAQEESSSAVANSTSRLGILAEAYNAISSYLVETSGTYKTGDAKAQKIISFQNGKIVEGVSGNSGVQTGKANQDSIYNYLAQKGFNDAAISGILANIQHESGFDPTALGDGGTSYGICQWHLGRWDRLKSYCAENNLDVNSVEGQAAYLVYELENYYPSTYEKIKNVPNNSQGAYDAAYEWTVNFEIPDDKYNRGDQRGRTAANDYWPTYGSNTVNV